MLIFVFGLGPGSPPVAASRIIRRYPSRITYVAPLVAFVFTLGAGTGNIFVALTPVSPPRSWRDW